MKKRSNVATERPIVRGRRRRGRRRGSASASAATHPCSRRAVRCLARGPRARRPPCARACGRGAPRSCSLRRRGRVPAERAAPTPEALFRAQVGDTNRRIAFYYGGRNAGRSGHIAASLLDPTFLTTKCLLNIYSK